MSLGSLLVTLTAAAVSAAASVAGTAAVDGASVRDSHVQATPVTPARAPWSWPLSPGPEVVHAFDPPDQPWLRGHRGVDLAAAVGQVVLTPTEGTVTFAGRLAGRGVVVVSHAGGLRSTFEPVDATVVRGAGVNVGDSVGTLSATAGHCAPVACLHWGVLRGRTYLDPLSFVGRGRIILLPLG